MTLKKQKRWKQPTNNHRIQEAHQKTHGTPSSKNPCIFRGFAIKRSTTFNWSYTSPPVHRYFNTWAAFCADLKNGISKMGNLVTIAIVPRCCTGRTRYNVYYPSIATILICGDGSSPPHTKQLPLDDCPADDEKSRRKSSAQHSGRIYRYSCMVSQSPPFVYSKSSLFIENYLIPCSTGWSPSTSRIQNDIELHGQATSPDACARHSHICRVELIFSPQISLNHDLARARCAGDRRQLTQKRFILDLLRFFEP